MVKAIRVHEPGSAEVLRYEDLELPPPGEGQVQIRHRAIGVNFIDIYRRTGAYPADYPFIPGHEGAGEVVAAWRERLPRYLARIDAGEPLPATGSDCDRCASRGLCRRGHWA